MASSLPALTTRRALALLLVGLLARSQAPLAAQAVVLPAPGTPVMAAISAVDCVSGSETFAGTGALHASWTRQNDTANATAARLNGAMVTSLATTDVPYFCSTLTLTNDQYSEVVIDGAYAGGNLYAGATVRAAGTTASTYDYYVGYVSATEWFLDEVVNGATTTLATGSITPAADDVIRISAVGTTISLYRNGTLFGSASDATLTAGAAGVALYVSGAGTAGIAAWAAGELVAADEDYFYVSKSGNDANSCATSQSPVQANQKLTVAAGLACIFANGPGSSLVVHAGTYNENLTSISADGTDWSCGSGAYCVSAAEGETVWIQTYAFSGVAVSFAGAEYHIWDGINLDGNSATQSGSVPLLYFSTATAGHHVRWMNSTLKNGWWSGAEGLIWDYLELTNVTSQDGGLCSDCAGAHAFYFEPHPDAGHDSHAVFDGLIGTGFDNGEQLDSGLQVYYGSQRGGGGLTIRNSRFHNNNSGMFIFDTGTPAVVLENVIVDHNGAGISATRNTAGFKCYQCVIANNGGWGIRMGDYGPVVGVVLTNSVIKDNTDGPILISNAYATSSITATYNDFHGNGNGNANDDQNGISTFDDNITSDPAFTNAAAGDYTVGGGSPLVNAGTDLSGTLSVNKDYVEVTRPVGAGYDIGAYER